MSRRMSARVCKCNEAFTRATDAAARYNAAMRSITLIIITAVFALAAAAPQKPAVVTITKNDGTTVRGQLGNMDLKAVSVTPLVKGKPEGEAQTVAWEEIKTIS